MPFEPVSVTAHSLQHEAYAFYHSLMLRNAAGDSAMDKDAEPGLGGSLFYAGELTASSQPRVIAGNVAGCATLVATADPAAQRQAIRDGMVDFVVTSLDESLRILKNEIRKRATVAVCVGAAPATVEREMVERGVLPDLVFSGLQGEQQKLPDFGSGTRAIQLTAPDKDLALLMWQVTTGAVRWMAKLDTIALECLRTDGRALRWIRLSPRYCGRNALSFRTLYCELQAARQIVQSFEAATHDGQIETEVVGSLQIGEEKRVFRF